MPGPIVVPPGAPPLPERYRAIRRLGAGAMGEVWLCDDLLLHRAVAVKHLRAINPAMAPDLERRFRREVGALARVSHPSVVKLLDAGVERDQPYVVFEFVAGVTLHHVLSERVRLPADHVSAMAVRLLEAAEAIHGANVLHRDIKPENVMLEDGRVLIIDLGLACFTDVIDAVTQTGAMVGTPAYMAPEQVTGAEVDGRADLYAIGATLFHALTGEPPFVGPVAGVLARKVGQDAPPTGSRSSAPLDLTDLIDALLARDPAQRPADAAAARRMLEPRAPVPEAGPRSAPGRGPASPRVATRIMGKLPAPARRPWAAVASVAAVALAVLLTAARQRAQPEVKLHIPSVEPGLTSARVTFVRTPPGGAPTLEIQREGKPVERVAGSAVAGGHGAVVTDLREGQEVTLRALDGTRRGPSLKFRMPGPVQDVEVSGTGAAVITVVTGRPLECRLRITGPAGRTELPPREPGVRMRHVFEVPAAQLPIAPAITLKLASGGEELSHDIVLGGGAREALARLHAAWLMPAVNGAFKSVAIEAWGLVKQGLPPSAFKVRLRPVVERALESLPAEPFFEELARTGTVHRVPPVGKLDLATTYALVSELSSAASSVGAARAAPRGRGLAFAKTRLSRPLGVALESADVDLSAPVELAIRDESPGNRGLPEVVRAEVNLGETPPGSAAELALAVTFPPGSCLLVHVNGEPPLAVFGRSTGAPEPLFVPLAATALRPGRNAILLQTAWRSLPWKELSGGPPVLKLEPGPEVRVGALLEP